MSAKTVGVSPGFAVTDEDGTESSVKQGPEAQVDVVMSRVLSAVGYRARRMKNAAKSLVTTIGVDVFKEFRPRRSK